MTGSVNETLWHIALLDDWIAARAAGDYRISTLGATLAEVGFIHSSQRHQLDGVATRFYADVTEPLVALEIDPTRVTVPVRLEPVAGPGSEEFPHIYGPLPISAVLRVIPARVESGALVLDEGA